MILKIVFEADSHKDLAIKLSQNRHLKTQYPSSEHRPVAIQNFESAAPDSFLLKNTLRDWDKKYKVKYFNEREREKRRIFISKGRFYQIVRHRPLSPHTQVDHFELSIKPFGEFFQSIISIDKYGGIFQGNTIVGYEHHSSLLGGEKGFFMGTIETDGSGNLSVITDGSGHYKGGLVNLVNCVNYLEKRGAVSPSLKIFKYKNNRESRYRLTDQDKDFKGEISPQPTTLTFEKWKSISNAGFFSRRYSILKEIDVLYADFFRMYTINSPKQQLELIDKLLIKIDIQKKTQQIFFKTKAEALKRISIDYEMFQITTP